MEILCEYWRLLIILFNSFTPRFSPVLFSIFSKGDFYFYSYLTNSPTMRNGKLMLQYASTMAMVVCTARGLFKMVASM